MTPPPAPALLGTTACIWAEHVDYICAIQIRSDWNRGELPRRGPIYHTGHRPLAEGLAIDRWPQCSREGAPAVFHPSTPRIVLRETQLSLGLFPLPLPRTPASIAGYNFLPRSIIHTSKCWITLRVKRHGDEKIQGRWLKGS